MLKQIALGSLGVALVLSPSVVLAQSTNSAAQIAALLAEVQQLQAQIPQLQGQSSASASSCLTLTHTLYVGLSDATTGGQVTELQQFLGVKATGYFGSLTQQAVQHWQSSHGVISSGSPNTTGYGSVGPKTRTAMGCTVQGQGSATQSIGTQPPTIAPSVPTSTSGNPGQMQTYTNAAYGFSFQYPGDFSMVDSSTATQGKVTVSGSQLYGPPFQPPSVLVAASADPISVSTCNSLDLSSLLTIASSPLALLGLNITPVSGSQTIAGVSFRSASATVDAKGAFLSLGFYMALHNGVCYVIGTTVEGTDPSTKGQLQSTSPAVLPASAANIVAEENAILQSLNFSIPTASASQTSSSIALSQAQFSLQDAVRKSDLAATQVDLELYYNQNGKYPSALTAMQSVVASTQDLYDPATFQPYQYQTDTAGDSYTLCATLSTGSPYCVQSSSTTTAAPVSSFPPGFLVPTAASIPVGFSQVTSAPGTVFLPNSYIVHYQNQNAGTTLEFEEWTETQGDNYQTNLQEVQTTHSSEGYTVQEKDLTSNGIPEALITAIAPTPGLGSEYDLLLEDSGKYLWMRYFFNEQNPSNIMSTDAFVNIEKTLVRSQ